MKIKRNERIGAMIKILTDRPGYILTLSHFSKLFGAAKSTISEDIDIAQNIMRTFELGMLETVTGASGGVRYIPVTSIGLTKTFINNMCMELSLSERILTGGFLYMLDILCDPSKLKKMGEIMADWFRHTKPDFVLTVETKGIPVALMTAQALNVPLVIARRDVRITDGSLMTINYVTGTGHNIRTMSLPRRTAKNGGRALIVDDFMKGGGTARGMVDLMKEFQVTVAGVCVVIATATPDDKFLKDYRSLMILNKVDEVNRKLDITPSKWVSMEVN